MERFAGIPERIFDPETANLVIDCVNRPLSMDESYNFG